MIPESVNILGQVYKVTFASLSKADGKANPKTYEIKLSKRLKKHPKYLLRVFWHEVAHAYAFESGLWENLDEQAIEQFCQTFSLTVITLTGGVLI